MPGRFFWKLISAFAGLLLASTAATDLLLTRYLRVELIEQLSGGLLTQGRLLEDRLRENSKLSRQELALQAARDCSCRVTVVDPEGKVLADSEVDQGAVGNMDNHAARSEVAGALVGRETVSQRRSGTLGKDFLYAAVPAGNGGGALRLSISLEQVDAQISRLRRLVVLVSGAALGAALLLAWAMARGLSRPVDEMAALAGRLVEGDYDARLRNLSNDELGRLGEMINVLAAKVSESLSSLSHEKAQLSAAFSHMEEGVIAVDLEGKVLVINPSLAGLVKVDTEASRGRPFLEVLRQSEVGRFLEEALREDAVRTGEARLFVPEERIFQVHAAPMREDGRPSGVLAVLHDITRLRKLEIVRRDFVANVSHEFRTPLSSIQGFAETLKGGAVKDPAQARDFLETIEAEAGNMGRLVDDLLVLSEAESGSRPPNPKGVDPLEAAKEVLESLRPLAEKRRVRLELSAGSGPRAFVDPAGLRQILMNLLSNAIKFNKEGGSVRISSREAPDGVAVEVSDTGTGIPREDLPRVFERFYRVDKARSRELGGTGLGLAIVKHVVEANGGTVSAESVEGQGATFRFTLPKA